jgi:hypothetical protein
MTVVNRSLIGPSFLLTMQMLANTAVAADWQVVAKIDEGTVYVDAQGIVLKDKLRRAWDRWNYAEDQAGFPDSGIRAFKASKHLAYYNCEDKTFAVAQVVYLDEKGKSLGQINVDVNAASFSVVVPDSVSEAQLRFVCAAKLGAKP